MSVERRDALLQELPSALLVAVLTAVVTLLLAAVLSAMLGREARDQRAETAENSARIINLADEQRCSFAITIEVLRAIDAGRNEPVLNDFPPVNIEGLDCNRILSEPFIPGRFVPEIGPSPSPIVPSR